MLKPRSTLKGSRAIARSLVHCVTRSIASAAAVFGSASFVPAAFAANFKTVEYVREGKTFEGFVASPSKPAKGALPGLVMIHNWMGITSETRAQAERFADLGYVVFAADVYGKGVRPKSREEAGALAGKYKADRASLRERLGFALEELGKTPGVDAKRLGVLGYCFGGTGALELARAGANVLAVISFHGGLDSPKIADGANVKGQVLVLHGADDPYVPAADLAAFEKEMATHKVDWQLVKFGNAVHSFTDKGAGNDNSKGAAYNALADTRSFKVASDFLGSVFER